MALSEENIIRIVDEAFRRQFGANHPDGLTGPWVRETYDDDGYAIVNYMGEFWRAGYSRDERDVTFAGREEWEKVAEERQWVVSPDNARALALKVVDTTATELICEGPLVLFGGRDLSGERFTKSTVFDSPYTRRGQLLIDWEHGQEPDRDRSGRKIRQPGRDDILGYVDWKTARVDEEIGVLARHVLDRREWYVREFVEPLVRAELVGTSSEAAPKGIKKSLDGTIQAWPLKRQSLTVMPMEPRMMLTKHQLHVVKSLAKYSPALKALLRKGGQETAADGRDARRALEIELNLLELEASL